MQKKDTSKKGTLIAFNFPIIFYASLFFYVIGKQQQN